MKGLHFLKYRKRNSNPPSQSNHPKKYRKIYINFFEILISIKIPI